MIAASGAVRRVRPRAIPYRLSFRHLADLSDGRGVFEHALHAVPRREHGYCLDDVARALVVVVREPRPTAVMQQLGETYLRFIEEAIGPDGLVHNRMDATGAFTDDAAMGDWWGRAVAALGFTVAHAELPAMRIRATRAFLQLSGQRPVDVRCAAFAVLGAAEVLQVRPSSLAARRMLHDALETLPMTPVAGWHWPEERLRYANATLPEAMIAAGDALGDATLLDAGLGYLDFLITKESRDGHLSVTGTAGRGPGELGPFFDQQPIEVAAIADASARAYALRGDPRWFEGVRRAWGWFVGENDIGLPMIDAETGAGFDGLEAGGRNENRGAESTLAALGTAQHARELGILGPWVSSW
jgi:hypothetical protein